MWFKSKYNIRKSAGMCYYSWTVDVGVRVAVTSRLWTSHGRLRNFILPFSIVTLVAVRIMSNILEYLSGENLEYDISGCRGEIGTVKGDLKPKWSLLFCVWLNVGNGGDSINI
jgi:hypothetical protein